MISPHLITFYQNWKTKVSQIVGNGLVSVFDRYATQFVIYNALYNEVAINLRFRGVILPKKVYDNELATKWTVKLIGAKEILERINGNGLEQDIISICSLIENEVFYIKLFYGQRQRDKDIELLQRLSEGYPKEKATAVLELLYHIRCNMLHGHKDFKEYQRQLIEPASRLLDCVLTLLYEELMTDEAQVQHLVIGK